MSDLCDTCGRVVPDVKISHTEEGNTVCFDCLAPDTEARKAEALRAVMHAYHLGWQDAVSPTANVEQDAEKLLRRVIKAMTK